MNTSFVVNKPKDTGLNVGLIILSFLVVLGIVLLIVYESKFEHCKKNEGSLCLTGNCPGNTQNTDINPCGTKPFKYDSSGKILCKTSIMAIGNSPVVQFS